MEGGGVSGGMRRIGSAGPPPPARPFDSAQDQRPHPGQPRGFARDRGRATSRACLKSHPTPQFSLPYDLDSCLRQPSHWSRISNRAVFNGLLRQAPRPAPTGTEPHSAHTSTGFRLGGSATARAEWPAPHSGHSAMLPASAGFQLGAPSKGGCFTFSGLPPRGILDRGMFRLL